MKHLRSNPTTDDVIKLWELCEKWIKTRKIYCPDDIFQNDDNVIDSSELFNDICKIVGYYEETESK